MAMSGEIDKNNNNIFNGKNLSDNTKVTSFYALKSAPPYQSPLLYFGQNQPAVAAGDNLPGAHVPESSMVKQLFTNDVALDQCKDCRAPDPASAKVSNLTQNPKINMKYDDAWFL